MMAALAPPPGSKSTAARAVLMSSDFIAFIFLLPVVTSNRSLSNRMMHKQTMRKQAGQTAFFGQKTNFVNQCSGLPLPACPIEMAAHVCRILATTDGKKAAFHRLISIRPIISPVFLLIWGYNWSEKLGAAGL